MESFMNTEERIRDISEELQSLSERLNDLSMSILSDAIERGETQRPAEEKRVAQARRAVEKALDCLQRSQ